MQERHMLMTQVIPIAYRGRRVRSSTRATNRERGTPFSRPNAQSIRDAVANTAAEERTLMERTIAAWRTAISIRYGWVEYKEAYYDRISWKTHKCRSSSYGAGSVYHNVNERKPSLGEARCYWASHAKENSHEHCEAKNAIYSPRC